MRETKTKGTMYALLQLLLHFSGLVAAVDITIYVNEYKCGGIGWLCADVSPSVCCVPNYFRGGAVLVAKATSSVLTKYYRGGGCADLVYKTFGDRCAGGGFYSGAFWVPTRRRSLLADDSEIHENTSTCDTQMEPTGIVYSQESTRGHWILTTNDTTGIYAQIVNIPDAQKVDWLQAHGATFQSSS